jgi:hypothetical protein
MQMSFNTKQIKKRGALKWDGVIYNKRRMSANV